MDCENCKERRRQAEPVAFIVHESDMARLERANKRLWITNIILIAVILAAVVWFSWREKNYNDVTETIQNVEQHADGDSDNRFVGGDIYGGIPTSNDPNG